MTHPHRIGLFWFNNDLRTADHAALQYAANQVDRLLCVFVLDSDLSKLHQYGLSSSGEAKRQFLYKSLSSLNTSLNTLNQSLYVFEGNTSEHLGRLINDYKITDVFRSYNSGYYENCIWQNLAKEHASIRFTEKESVCLFEQSQLPFSLDQLPATFTKFRKLVESIAYSGPASAPKSLPAAVFADGSLLIENNLTDGQFKGGETNGHAHLKQYFSGSLPTCYKEVRNALDGWDNSTKFSPWLAHGCFSPRQVLRHVQDYEADKGANESTYWIYFELLWREYFQWNARKYENKLFMFSGTKYKAPVTQHSAERFKNWCSGNTPYPLVNACMNELRLTGYLSNRSRQIVASCFVNELQLDWRYGAAYFESMLIDYDVAANWGNWQYLAGVGADVQDKRHFNLEKQSLQFDPLKEYTNKWTNPDIAAARKT